MFYLLGILQNNSEHRTHNIPAGHLLLLQFSEQFDGQAFPFPAASEETKYSLALLPSPQDVEQAVKLSVYSQSVPLSEMNK